MDECTRHNLKMIGFEDCIELFKENDVDFDLFKTMSSGVMAAIFQGRAKLMSLFELKYQQLRETGWKNPGTEQIFLGTLTVAKSERLFEWTTYEEDTWTDARAETQPTGSSDGTNTQEELQGSIEFDPLGNEKEKETRKRPLGESQSSNSKRQATYQGPNIVEEHLKQRLHGRGILKAGKNGRLDDTIRHKMCGEIVWAELGSDADASISRDRFEKLRDCIVNLFPRELGCYYYTPRIKKNGTQKAVQPKGILYDKYHNILRYLRALGMRKSQRCGDDENEDFDYDEDNLAEGNKDIEYLQKHSTVCQKITTAKWKATADYRKNLLWNLVCRKSRSKSDQDKISTYFTQFECLRQPWGLSLILDDFNLWLSDRSVDIVHEWTELSQQLATFLKVEKAATETGTTVNVLRAIPKLFRQPILCDRTRKVPKGEKRPSWKPSAKESGECFLLFVKDIADLEPRIERAKLACRLVGRPLQPFPAIVGQTVDSITDCYIVLDGWRYSAESPLVAFDSCFKLYHALHAEYPAQSSYSWLFAQQALYNLHTEVDGQFPPVEKAVNDFKRLQTNVN